MEIKLIPICIIGKDDVILATLLCALLALLITYFVIANLVITIKSLYDLTI